MSTSKMQLHFSLSLSISSGVSALKPIVKDVIGLSLLEFFYSKPLSEKTFVCIYSEIYHKFKSGQKIRGGKNYSMTNFEARIMTYNYVIQEKLAEDKVFKKHTFMYMEGSSPLIKVDYQFFCQSSKHESGDARHLVREGFIMLEDIPKLRDVKSKCSRFFYVNRHALNFDLSYVLSSLKLDQKANTESGRTKEIDYSAPLSHPAPPPEGKSKLALPWKK